MSWQDVCEMPASIFNEFWESITVIEAQNMLTRMTVADYPHVKKEDRTKIHRKLYKLAHPDLFESEEKAISVSDIGKVLGRLTGG